MKKIINIVHPVVDKLEKKNVCNVLDSRMLASGKQVIEFEKSFAKYSGSKFGIATSNGTTSLHTALLMCGIKPGDKIITTSFTFVSTINSIIFCGAEPIFVDIDKNTFNIDAHELEKTLKKEKNIKAVLIVHLYGLPCDMDEILKLKLKYNFLLIEDSCQAHGAEFKKKKVGSFGDAGVFSFYATKNIMMGEGGIIITNNYKFSKYARQIINHGKNSRLLHVVLGYNYRLTNVAAAIGIVQLKRLDYLIKKRIDNAKKYNEAFSNLSFLKIPCIPKYCKHTFNQYTIKIEKKERKKFINHLKNNGIISAIYYNFVVYKQPFYSKFKFNINVCNEAEKISKEVVSIPVHPSLTDKNINKIIKVIRSYKK
jgi:perosamine synthetase